MLYGRHTLGDALPLVRSFPDRKKPTDNAFIESFNRSLRDECLNVNWFLSLEDAQQKLDVWKENYNSYIPH